MARLEHQQERMSRALRRMAAIIAKHESGIDRPASEFDIIDLLEQYAPTVSAKRPIADLAEPQPDAFKRSRTVATSINQLSNTPHNTGISASQAAFAAFPINESQGQSSGLDGPYILEPNPAAFNGSASSKDILESMVQFMKMTTNPNQTSGIPNETMSSLEIMPNATTSADSERSQTLPSSGMDQRFVEFIDWEASLANFSDSLFDSPVASSMPGQSAAVSLEGTDQNTA